MKRFRLRFYRPGVTYATTYHASAAAARAELEARVRAIHELQP